MDKWAVYFVVVGVILLAAGYWTYQSATPYIAVEELVEPAECGGTLYLLDPSYLASEYNVRVYAYYPGNFTVDKVADYDVRILVANDPCAEGQAYLVVSTPNGVLPQVVPVQGSPEYLASYLLAPQDMIMNRPEAAGESGMGVFGSRLVSTSQQMVVTQYVTMENRFYNLYYDEGTGLLVKQEEARQILVALRPAPQQILIERSLLDYGRSTGPEGELVYQGRAAELVALYSIAGAAGILTGLASIGYGAWLLLSAGGREEVVQE